MKHVKTPQTPKPWTSKKYKEEIETKPKPVKKAPKYKDDYLNEV